MQATEAHQALPLPRLIRAPEVAAATGLSLQRVYALSRKGVLPTVRLGRSVRYDAHQIALWLRSGGTSSNGDGNE